MAADLVCMGEPMLEYAALPPDAAGRTLYLEGHGGDTSNAAIAAARQGARVAYASAVGEDAAGEGFLALWAREGIDTTAVRRDPARPTAIYFIRYEGGRHHFHFYRAGSAAAGYRPEDVPEAMIAGARMFFASGISQAISDSAADAVFRAIEIARANGVAVAYDTNYRPRLWPPARAAAVMHAAIARADYALPSREDAEVLSGLADPDAILDFYLRLGPRVVVLKLGAEGALVASPAGRVRIPPHPCRPVDATGAGDTFCGAFLARILAGDGPEAAARYAGVAAALATEGQGAVAPMPRAERVRAAMAAAAEARDGSRAS